MKHAVTLALACTGCLGPQVSDELAASGDIVPAGTAIPSIDEDAEDAAVIAANDGVDGLVPRLSAFAAGAPTHAWDFGPAPEVAAPMYVMMKREADGTLTRLPHDAIIGTIPGEPGYSPFWQEFALVVTDAYHGELVTSTTAIEEAERAGLIEAPVAQPLAVNWPVVAGDVRLDVGTGTPVAATSTFLYEHHTVRYFSFGPLPVAMSVRVTASPRYVLRRDGQEPLSEPIRGVDIDGDGDTADTNDVYDRAATDPMRSPLCRRIDVAVTSGTASIDTSMNDAVADVKTASQLFAPDPVPGMVVAFETTDELTNCPQQRTAGGL